MKFTRNEIWNHNSLLGTVVFASKGLLRIINSRTATTNAKIMAQTIINDLEQLQKALKVRADAE